MRFFYVYTLFYRRHAGPRGHGDCGADVENFPSPYQAKGLAYSTELTRKDPDAWTAAHRHCARLWMRTGIISGGASAFLMVLFRESYSSFWMWLIVGQMALFCVSVFMIDLLLKNTFEKDEKNNDL